jgi:hypothetical protein
MRASIIAFVCLLVSTAWAERASVSYVGLHPLPKSDGGGLCYIEGPHVHAFAADKLQYREHDGHHFFVGDPVAYGYDGPRYVYKGHHPIHVHEVLSDDEIDVEFCYLDGPHYHYFSPPLEADFKVVGETYFFVGTPPKGYVEVRPAMVKINAMYKPLVYARPVVTVAAPVGWIGVTVKTPAVVVRPARPVIHIGAEVQLPIVIIEGHGHGHYRHHKHKKHKYRRWRRRGDHDDDD